MRNSLWGNFIAVEMWDLALRCVIHLFTTSPWLTNPIRIGLKLFTCLILKIFFSNQGLLEQISYEYKVKSDILIFLILSHSTANWRCVDTFYVYASCLYSNYYNHTHTWTTFALFGLLFLFWNHSILMLNQEVTLTKRICHENIKTNLTRSSEVDEKKTI